MEETAIKKLLTADAILATTDLQVEEVFIPAWGASVLVKGLNGHERDRFEASISTGGKVDLSNIRAKMVALSVVNDQGQRVFTDKHVAQLGLKSAAALDLIFDAARRLSGMKKEDVEQLTKNSSTDQKDGSGLD